MTGPLYFAYAGGTIPEPTTLVTNGSTHGGVTETLAIVGDLSGNGNQIINLATGAGLAVGQLYFIAGPGIPANDFFIYGGGDSLNLNQPGTANILDQTFTVTKPIPIGDVVATLSQGSSVVNLGNVPDLVPGVYGLAGTGIGQTRAPVPTTGGTTTTTSSGNPIELLPSAFFLYSGGGIANLQAMVATPNTITGFDSFGNETEIITYTVGAQAVTATASGQFACIITGLPTQPRTSITDIPAAALASLTAGLQYNISGPGLPVGTTFLAPSIGGATSITIDQDATASGLGVELLILGPRTPNAPFNPIADARFDENVLSIDIEQEEGGFATLRIDIPNPGVGLLAVGRNLWCWLSWDSNWTPAGTSPPNLVPLFNGRLVGVPKLQSDEFVTLEFLARPDDFNAQKLAIATSLQTLPNYDPVWLAANVNPDTVLETYSSLFHVDRTSLTVTTSDIITGEDGTIAIGESEAFYDAFGLTYSQPPLNAVTVSGTVAWTQEGDGTLDFTSAICGAFSAQGSPFGSVALAGQENGISGGGLIGCLCGSGLFSDWPKAGVSIGGGWTLSTRTDSEGIPLCYIVDAVISNNGGWLPALSYQVSFAGQIPTSISGQTSPASGTPDASNVNQFFNPFGQLNVSFPLNIYKIRMNVDYKAARKRTETISAVVTADVQQVLSDPAAQDVARVNLTSQYVDQAVDPGGVIPIGDIRLNTYFKTDRGTASFEYLLLLARAKLRARARAVDVTFAVPWAIAVGLTLRMSATYTDRRLPGGTCTGKVKKLRLRTSENDGMWGEFTIGCSIGHGVNINGAAGTNSYALDGYMDPGYQVVTDDQVQLVNNEIAYETLDDFVVADDGIDLQNLTASAALNECVVTNGLTTQLSVLRPYQGGVFSGGVSPLSTMRQINTQVLLDLKPLQGSEFHTDFFPSVTQLAMPKTIDLEQG